MLNLLVSCFLLLLFVFSLPSLLQKLFLGNVWEISIKILIRAKMISSRLQRFVFHGDATLELRCYLWLRFGESWAQDAEYTLYGRRNQHPRETWSRADASLLLPVLLGSWTIRAAYQKLLILASVGHTCRELSLQQGWMSFPVCLIQKEDPGETEIIAAKELMLHISTSAQLVWCVHGYIEDACWTSHRTCKELLEKDCKPQYCLLYF